MDFDDWHKLELEKLQERIGYFFADASLLKLALIHSSYKNEHGTSDCNERLEFLGDSVLQLFVSRSLFLLDTDLDEGGLTRRRAALVCGSSLRRWSEHLGLRHLLLTGKSLAREEICGSIMADAAEALLGAVYLDGGASAAEAAVDDYLSFISTCRPGETSDPKSSLQILAHEKGLGNPLYEVVSVSGPSHRPLYTVRVIIAGASAGEGEGTSRKSAEFAAAREGLLSLSGERKAQ